eukprot:UN01102
MHKQQRVQKRAPKANKAQKKKVAKKPAVKQQKRSFKASKAVMGGYMVTPQPDFDYDATPAPEGYAYRYTYTPEPDFFKDEPVEGTVNKLIRAFRNRFGIQSGNPAFFDRDYEQQKLLTQKGFEQYKYNLTANTKGGFQGYDELDFNTSYYKRVGLQPKLAVGGKEDDNLLFDPNLSLWRESPNHLLLHHNVFQPQYLEWREHTMAATGVISPGAHYVERTKFEFPIVSADSDYLYFHHSKKQQQQYYYTIQQNKISLYYLHLLYIQYGFFSGDILFFCFFL